MAEEVEILVRGMTCSHCERALIEGLGRVQGVLGVDADASTGRVELRLDSRVLRHEVEDAIAEAGFTLAAWPDRDL